MKKVFSGCIIAISLVISSCSSDEMIEKKTLVKEFNINCEDTTAGFKLTGGSAYKGNFFSRADSSNQYGYCAAYVLPDSLIGKDLKVYVNGWCRSTEAGADEIVAVSIQKAAEVGFWGQVEMNKFFPTKDEWKNFSDSIVVTSDKNMLVGAELKIFPCNSSKKGSLDIDELSIKIFKTENVLPN